MTVDLWQYVNALVASWLSGEGGSTPTVTAASPTTQGSTRRSRAVSGHSKPMVGLQRPQNAANTWILGRHVLENYFVVYDNRPTESGESALNSIGIGACGSNTVHVNMVDDQEGRENPVTT